MARKTKQEMALERELQSRIAVMEEDHIRCRDLGHVWREFVPGEMRKPSFGWRRSLRCDPRRGGCGAERHELIDISGNIASREYRYPEGYQMVGLGVRGTPAKHWFRREYYRRHAGSGFINEATQMDPDLS